ncbi:MAG: hypothetical protein IAE97_04940 [Chthoniobacterales bacterium]|nr:hypothetical protein [Chthoniobacterales bacterium]
MKKYIVTGLVAVIAATSSALAGTDFKKTVVEIEDPCVFRDSEFQIDAFGQGAFYNQGSPGWGGGLGLNYFFMRYVGIGIEQSVFGREDHGAEWATLGNLFLRYPICSWNMAPYAIIGGGARYGDGGRGKGVGTVGGGLEIRLTDHIGLFGDARWLYTNVEPKSGVLARTGIRYAF